VEAFAARCWKQRAGKASAIAGGDPFLFGRGSEEAEVLARHGIPFEVVPGVCSPLGASAYAGISLTHRVCIAVAFVTGHDCPDKPDSRLDWDALARFPSTNLHGMTRLPRIVEALPRGKDPGRPRRLSIAEHCEQQTVLATLAGCPQPWRQPG
jgi:uroporphyrinogen III methyltransferase/synthase